MTTTYHYQHLADQTQASAKLSRGRRIYDPERVAFVILGFNHATTHTPWPREYEGWTENQQKNYENGRLVAFNTALAGLKTLFLTLTPRGYNKYRDLREAAIQAVGPHAPAKEI